MRGEYDPGRDVSGVVFPIAARIPFARTEVMSTQPTARRRLPIVLLALSLLGLSGCGRGKGRVS